MFESFASNSRLDFLADWFDRASGRDKWAEADGAVVENIWLPPCDGLDGYYRINYSYRAVDQEFSGWFSADDARPIGELVVIRYNPRNPKSKYRAGFRSGREPAIIVLIGVGAAIFFTIWYSVDKLIR